MKATCTVEVIPVWFIEKWLKENAEEGSTLDFFMKRMIKDWQIEEKRNESSVSD